MAKKINKIEILGANEAVPDGIRCVNPDPLGVFKEMAKNPDGFEETDPMARFYAILNGDVTVPEEPNTPFEQDGQTIFPAGCPIPMRGFKPFG